MNTVITYPECPGEWYQDTYICSECDTEFMIDYYGHPKFCPCCGVKYDAVQMRYENTTETIFNDEREENK